MSSTNRAVKSKPVYTHGGAQATRASATIMLERTIMSCMLWEDGSYEDGKTVAERIAELVPQVPADACAALAIKARTTGNLRHVPLLVVREMARTASHKRLVADTLAAVIQRPDELTEFVALYWATDHAGRSATSNAPLASQVKKGLAKAFTKFNAHSLAKYDRNAEVKLRDVLFLCHAKPKDVNGVATFTRTQRKSIMAPRHKFTPGETLFKQVAERSLPVPDTWEVQLSAGADKKATFTHLMLSKELGGLAFLRNLRNMHQEGVDKTLVDAYMGEVNFDRVLPFRFVAAAKAVPQWVDIIDRGMLRAVEGLQKLPGKTIVIIDCSGSMQSTLSVRSEMNRIDAAGALAVLAREMCEDCVLYATAGSDTHRKHATIPVPSYRGLALADKFSKFEFRDKIGTGGIFLTQVIEHVKDIEREADRIIVFTDEQDCDTSRKPATAEAFAIHNYIVNVATDKHGIIAGKWHGINGFSDAVLQYMLAYEESEGQ